MIKRCRRTILLASLVLLGVQPALGKPPQQFDKERHKFIDEMVDRHSFERKSLDRLLHQAEYQQKIIDTIKRPAEGLPWHRYRNIFLGGNRAQQGVTFWNEHADLLARAEQQFGVPAQIIVAIIGVETRYGRHAGNYPVLDALSTLAFGYPRRSSFFRRELEQFLLLSREEKIDPRKALGSYAGAMGQPQFIPSSYRSYAIDFDNDGQRDLWRSPADVIGSVAAYFERHGWRRGEPVTEPVSGINSAHEHFIRSDMKPAIKIGQLRAANLDIGEHLADDALTSLVRLEGKQGNEHWLGLHNFYVITRYNHSNLYAMAVYQLSQEILRLRQSGE